jgi:hypothetical protein
VNALTGALGLRALGGTRLAVDQNMTTQTYTVNSTDPDGDVNASAQVTVSGNTITVVLTDLTTDVDSDGQALSGVKLDFASAPTAPTTLAQAGQLMYDNSGTWTSESGDPTHWGTAVSGNSLYLATAGIGAQPNEPFNLIVDGNAGDATDANKSVPNHDPHISNTGTFTLTFSGPPPSLSGLSFEFGTNPQDTGYTIPGTPCFLAGTRIAVSASETADIETLKAGDLVLTHDGRQVPVLWAGRHTVSRRFADPRHLPIRIAAGALGGGAPERDLLVSPCHALLIEGVLVQAGALVNGVSITVETATAETFVYYHLETEDHSLILAEGVPAETFIDNIGRMAFDNWDEHQALFPNGRDMAELDLPRVTSARQLPAAIASRISSFGAAA